MDLLWSYHNPHPRHELTIVTIMSQLRLPSMRSLTRMPVFRSVPSGKMKMWCPPDFLPCKRRDWKDTQHPIKCSTVTVTLHRFGSFWTKKVNGMKDSLSNLQVIPTKWPLPWTWFLLFQFIISARDYIRERFLKAGEIWSCMLFECSKRKHHLCYAAATLAFVNVYFYTYNTYF